MKAFGGTSGASGYSATPLSRAQFARVGEHACVSLRQQLKAATRNKPGNLTAAARSVRRITSIVDRVRTELYGVIPPPTAGVTFRHLLGDMDTADRALHRLNGLTETGQWQRATLLVRSRGWQDIDKRLGPSTNLADIRCGRARSTSAILTAVSTRASAGTSAASYYFAKPLTAAQLARATERICVSARARLEQIVAQKPQSLTDAATTVEKLTSSLDSFVTQLRALTPPPSLAAPWQRLLGNLQIEDRALHNLDELGRLGEWSRALHLVRSRWWQHMAKRFGPPVRPSDIRCG
jgi:hypothetical protein